MLNVGNLKKIEFKRFAGLSDMPFKFDFQSKSVFVTRKFDDVYSVKILSKSCDEVEYCFHSYDAAISMLKDVIKEVC